VQLGGRVGPTRGAADDYTAPGPDDRQGCLPGRLADVLDDDVDAVAAGGVPHCRRDVAACVVDDRVGAEPARPLQLRVGRRCREHARAERLGDRERSRGDATADSPDEDPFACTKLRLRDEHPVGRLEHQRERRRLLERELVGDRHHVIRGHRDQLGVRAVAVLADDQPAVVEARVDHDPLAVVDALAGAVRAEDPRLRHRGSSAADPEVDAIQRGRP